MNGEPGFSEEVFLALSAKVKKEAEDNSKVVCSLLMDEMSIKKHLEWDGQRFRGYVDVGTEIVDDSLPLATEALVMMVVAMNARDQDHLHTLSPGSLSLDLPPKSLLTSMT